MSLQTRCRDLRGPLPVSLRPWLRSFLAISVLFAPGVQAFADNGVWDENASGNWGTNTNWASNIIASGSGFTADFNSVDLTANRTVTLEGPYTIGNIIFGDTATGTPFSFTIANGGNSLNILTMAGTTPTITVNTAGATASPVTPHTISAEIAGVDGLSLAGPGIIRLNGTNTFTGDLNIGSGTTLWAANNASLGDAANDVYINGGILRTAIGGNTTIGTGRTFFLGTGGGTLQIGGSFVQNVIGANIDETVAGAVLTINGSGAMYFSGTHTHTGGTVIDSGRVFYNNTAVLQTEGLITINNGGTLVAQNGIFPTVNAALATGRIDPNSTGAIALNGNSTSTPQSQAIDFTGYAGLFLGSASETNYTGSLTPHGNTYRLGGGTNNLRMGAENQLVDIDGSTPRFLIVGTGNGSNSNVVWFNAANTFSGGTTINTGGVAYLRNNAGLGTGVIQVNTGYLQLDNSVSFNNAITLNGDNANGSVRAIGSEVSVNGDIEVTATSRIVATNTAGVVLNLNNITLTSGTLNFQAGLGVTGGTTGGQINVNGVIDGAGNISKVTNSNILNLNGDNTFTGNVSHSAGILGLGHDNALGGGAGTFSISGNVTVRSTTAATRTVGKAIGALSGGSNTIIFGSSVDPDLNGNLNFTNSAAASISGGTRTLEVHNTTSFSTVFTGTGNIIKTGDGALLLNGANTYSGSTTVNAGTLGGTGTVRALTINAATLAPGNSIGTLNAGNTNLTGSSTFAVEVGNDLGDPGLIFSDRLNVVGTMTIGAGANLELTFASSFGAPQVGDTYFLITNDGVDAISGVFTQFNGIDTDLSQGATVTWGDYEFLVSYTGDSEAIVPSFTGGNDLAIQFTAVPEPGAGALVLGVLGLLILVRRRRKGLV